MSEVEVEAQEVIEPTENQGENKPLSYEELAAELAKVRKEAAAKRVKNKELDSELEQFRKWKDSQMTELERAQNEAKNLKEQRKADAIEIAQTKFGLEAEDLEFLRGDSKEEILASAEKLASRLGRKQGENNNLPGSEVNPNLFPGTRGSAVGAPKGDANDYLRAQLRGEV